MNTYKVTYQIISTHPEIGDYTADTDYLRVEAPTAAEAKRRLRAAAETANIRIVIVSALNEDAAFERRVRSAERARALN